MRFFPSGRSNPVLPPSDASTIESNVVGTATQLMPRIYVEAAKPAMSPITPPPRAMTVLLRSSPFCRKDVHNKETVSRFLYPSPAGMTMDFGSHPAARKMDFIL